jgi:hypothetical protein
MKVFISWSGETSRSLADALHNWLLLVLHYVEPWMSDVDIDAGDRWGESVAKELEASNFGIICVTRENVSSSWILFEAGALAKSMKGSRVIPLLFDLDFRDISGPLAQFQAKKLEKSGIGEVVQSINQSAESPDDQGRATQLFDALWPQLEAAVDAIPTDTEPAKHARPQGEILEEMVASIRTLDARVRDMSDPVSPQRRRKATKRQVMMATELAHMSMEGPGDPANLLTLASAFRQNVPWLADLGVEAYRLSVEESPHADRVLERFLRGVETALHGPFSDRMEFDFEPGFLRMLLNDSTRIRIRPKVRRSEVDREHDQEDARQDD